MDELLIEAKEATKFNADAPTNITTENLAKIYYELDLRLDSAKRIMRDVRHKLIQRLNNEGKDRIMVGGDCDAKGFVLKICEGYAVTNDAAKQRWEDAGGDITDIASLDFVIDHSKVASLKKEGGEKAKLIDSIFQKSPFLMNLIKQEVK